MTDPVLVDQDGNVIETTRRADGVYEFVVPDGVTSVSWRDEEELRRRGHGFVPPVEALPRIYEVIAGGGPVVTPGN